MSCTGPYTMHVITNHYNDLPVIVIIGKTTITLCNNCIITITKREVFALYRTYMTVLFN